MKEALTLFHKIPLSIYIFSLVLFTASCASEEAVLKSPEDVVERIDMVLEDGDDKEYIYLEALEANTSNDLIRYNFAGETTNQMDFKLQIGDDRILTFKVYNSNQPNFWELEGSEYSLHPNQEVNSVYKHVTAEITNNGETSYTTNLGYSFPNQVETDVFRIKEYNPENHEILIHIENFPIARETSSSDIKTLMINGTFRGSLTFMN